jgi:hypothetical protein
MAEEEGWRRKRDGGGRGMAEEEGWWRETGRDDGGDDETEEPGK